MTLKDFIEIAQSVSIIVASLFAIYGFDAWRREHIEIRRIELAEEVLALFYQARDAIESIRSPLGFGGEGQSRKPSENESPEKKQVLDQAYVLIERYNKHSELFSRINSLRYKFMALMGQDSAQPFNELNKILYELVLSSRQMAWDSSIKIDQVYYGGGEDDPIVPRVNKIIEKIEGICRNIIEGKNTLFSTINIGLSKFALKVNKAKQHK